MLNRPHLGRAGLICAVLFLALPAAALADGAPQFVIGPIKVKHGYTASALGLSCGTKFASGTVVYTKSGKGWTENHTYGGPNNATCKIAKDLSSGTLKFSFAGVTVNITFRKQGRLKHGPLPPGCHGAKPATQPGIATGTIKASFAKSFFGSVNVKKAKASVSKVTYTCSEPPSYKKTTFLTAFSGGEASGLDLSATQPPSGPRSVLITRFMGGRNGSQSHTIALIGGSSLFSAASDLSSAKVNGSGKVSGHLTFKATPSCKGTDRTGTLSGQLVASFDLIGKQTVKENKASPATLSRNATAGPCK